MKRIDLFFKVEAELGEGESAERLAREIIRMLEKMYPVRKAELANVVNRLEE